MHLLSCPNCEAGFEQHDKSLVCENGHSFDIARQGYVNLATPSAAKKASDTRAMVDARLRFLERGFYRPLSDHVAGLVSSALHEVEQGARTVIDVGCGPGFYLMRLVGFDRIWGGGIMEGVAGVDLSKAAVRAAAKQMRGEPFVVADVEEGIPVRAAAFGVVLSVFAPRPVRELRRIVRTDGSLVIAAAGPDHLRELREELNLMQVRPDKEAVLAEQLSESFEVRPPQRLTFTIDLDDEGAQDLVTMGPNFWHRSPSSGTATAMTVTADFLLLTARPR